MFQDIYVGVTRSNRGRHLVLILCPMLLVLYYYCSNMPVSPDDIRPGILHCEVSLGTTVKDHEQ